MKWLSWQTEADQAFLEGLLNGIEDQRDPQAASVLLDAVHSRFGGQVKKKRPPAPLNCRLTYRRNI